MPGEIKSPIVVVVMGGEHIEATCLRIFRRVILEVMSRCRGNFPLLPVGDTLGSSAESGIAAVADLDKDQGFSILRDDINFAESASIIPLHNLQSVLFEPEAGIVFDSRT